MKYKIFVSGVQKEMKEERNAVKELVIENYLLKDYFTVFLFEALPAKSKSAEEIYLKEVNESDIYIGILGNEYGKTGEDGLSPVEKEYLEAKKADKEIWFFIKGEDSHREDKLKTLIKGIRKGHCYQRFNTITELKNGLFLSLIDFLKSKGIVSKNAFDESVCEDVTFDDIDEEKVRWFLGVARNKRKYPIDIDTSVKDMFIHLNLLNGDKLTKAAILLFGKTPSKHLRQAEIKCIQLAGTQFEKPFSSYQIYNANLFEQIDKAVAFVLDSIKFPVIQQEHTAQVKRQHEIPVFVIQEAIVNAAIHRDYNNTGAVQVMVFIDHVEILNPGGLTNHLTVEKLKKHHTSYPTNSLIAHVVYLADYAQKAGSGTIEMVKQCRVGRIPEPEFVSTRQDFKAIIARDIYTESALNKLGLNERQKKAIQYVKEKGKITNKEYREMFSITDRTALYDLTGLCSKRVFERLGKTGRSTVYALTRNKPEKPEINPNQTRPELHNQTPPEPNFVGRVEMLSTITQWYKDPKVRIGALIGWGGVGKSALVRKWYDSFLECINHVDACSVTDTALHIDGIFWWGFYRSAYLEAFLNALLRYVSQGEIDPGTMKSSYEKVDKIKGYLQQSSYLIILDGLEQMQKGESGEEFGRMEHYELTELLHYLADADISSFCLITTRYPLKNLEEWNESSYKRLELIDLSIPDSLAMLKKRGTKGDDEDIKEIVARYKGHALSLTSLAGYLNKYYNGDIKQASDIEFIFGDKERFKDMNRLLQRYSEKMSEAELCFLNIFSLFRKEVTEKEFSGVFQHNIGFNDVLVNMNELSFKDLLNGLVEWRLISFDETKSSYTTHPLTKSYFESAFNEKDKKLCHKRIYHYFGEYAPEKPETLEEMQPLFEQVYHGCSAGLYDEVYKDVYWEKIERRDESFIVHKLGAWETDISLVKMFFPKCDLSKMPLVSKNSDQGFLLNLAGLALFQIGRPKEAEEPLLTGVQINIDAKDWKNASEGYQNLADLQFRTGRLKSSLETAKNSLKMTEKEKYDNHIITSKAYLAWIFHLSGNTKEASNWFREADELQIKIDPDGDRLYSLRGVFYADFLISIKKVDEAFERTIKNLKICQNENWPDDISRCHRAISAIKRIKGNYEEARSHLQNALEIARKVGMPYLEIEALLESGRLHLDTKSYPDAISEANQVLKLCDRTGFKLYEPDAELILARAYLSMECSVHDTACIDTVDALQNKAKSFAQSAYDKATSMHYHLPKLEAEHLLTKKE